MSSPRLIALVVEDEPSDYELIEFALQRCQSEVALRWVRDGAEAKAYLSGQGDYADRDRFPLPHLVVADLNMPRLTGHQLIAWIRGEEAVRRLPIVVMTSSVLAPDVDRAYEAGANAYFTKPSSLDGLTELWAAIIAYWSKAAHPRP